MLAELWYDLKAAARYLLRKPAFVAVAALTLAMGVGATTVAFSLVNQVLLRPLPGVRDPDGAAYVQFAPLGVSSVSYPDFELLRDNASLVEGLAYYTTGSVNVTLDQARPVEVRSSGVAGDFFEVLGVTPLLGRLLVHADGDLVGDPFVVVISERLWATLFDRAPGVVGRSLKVGDQTLQVIGVTGGGFAGAERGRSVDLWMPWPGMWMLLSATPDDLMSRKRTGVRDLVVRPQPGATPAAIEGQLNAILARAAASFPESAENLSGIRAELFPGLHSPPIARLRTYRSLILLAGVVALVLLIACANVANLLLFRGVTRSGEVATRRALGASTTRIARQHVAESLVIALVGTALGLAVGWVIGLPFRGFPLFYAVAFEGIAFDVRVILFGGATVLLTTLLFGVVPAILAGRADPAAALAEAGTRETGRGSILRSGMAAVQLALSLSLLFSALLLVRTLGKLYATDTGFSYERVATTYLEVGAIPEDELDVAMHEIIEAVKAVPGVRSAALADRAPFTYGTFGRIRRPERLDSLRNPAFAYTVTPDWFDVLGVQAVSGSTLSAGDWQPGAPSRVIFSEGLARRYFSGENMIGRTITAGFGRRLEESEFYGVIPDLGLSGPGESRTEFFVHSPFEVGAAGRVAVLARTTELNADVLSGITAAVERAVPQVPVPDAFPLKRLIDDKLAQQRLFARMIGLVAALSVLLAAVGLYGVVAFTVAGRRREMGIRLTLGADGRDLANLVARYALGVVGLGVALGLMGASWLEDVLNRWLFDLVPVDPVSYGALILMFVVVAVLACWVPTRSAMRVDPAVTLRAD